MYQQTNIKGLMHSLEDNQTHIILMTEDNDWLDDIALYTMIDNNETVITMSPKAFVNKSKHILLFSISQSRKRYTPSINQILSLNIRNTRV